MPHIRDQADDDPDLMVSVAVITFNHEGYIREAIESVLCQKTDFAFELVIGDDASTDATPQILRDIKKHSDIPIELLLAEDNYGDWGLTNFMNVIDQCRGRYVALLDGDDCWIDQSKLQAQVDFFQSHPSCDLCTHLTKHVWEDGTTLISPPSPGSRQLTDVGALIVTNFSEKSATVVRRQAIEKNVPNWYRSTDAVEQDWLFNVLVSRSGKIGFINRVMALHRIHSDSVTVIRGLDTMFASKLKTVDLLAEIEPLCRPHLLRAKVTIWAKRVFCALMPSVYLRLKKVLR